MRKGEDRLRKNKNRPSKKYYGKFVVGIPPGAHRRLAIKAAEEGVSLNRLISAKLSREIR